MLSPIFTSLANCSAVILFIVSTTRPAAAHAWNPFSKCPITLSKPTRVVYASVGKLAQGNDPLKAVESCLKSCYIGGDDLKLILENEDALMSCEAAVVKMLEKKEAVLKKN